MQLPEPVMTAEELNAFLQATFPQFERPYRVLEVTPTGAVLHLAIGPEHERPGGTVSGPTMMGLADAAAWLATLSRIGPVALSVTSSLTINFLRKPSLDHDLLATASLLKLGRRLSVTEVHLTSGDDLVAQSTVTYAIPSSASPGSSAPSSGSSSPSGSSPSAPSA
ncbi:MAG TPA: PaaI family thioesterase [Acidimicrobiales bacterium]